ncbi:CpsD/CapB family tyrosine-protein kinase [Sphingomonas mesophila]|uniref:CpsD/CapB family tyrosine-protein kinase n=1 Tax=Sphingomonas mesophila TaxID=2303576 RepID=UPI000E581A72|nr:CpsD/CapB family tyrosine-protein kinase [Sphingomonas mesophila]
MTPVEPIKGLIPPVPVQSDWARNSLTAAIDHAFLKSNGIYALDSKDPRSRPFVQLRSQILKGLEGLGGRVIAVTSASAANGKSHVAANLACALSRVRSTTLIDLHLRRPVIGERFGLTADQGVGAYLAGDEADVQLGLQIEGERLTVHTSGPAIDDSSDLLMSPRLERFFAQIHRDPDEPVCVVDTPPVLESDDMTLIARQVDGLLVVIEEGRTTKTQMIETLRLLEGVPIVGTLLNKAMDPLAPLHR